MQHTNIKQEIETVTQDSIRRLRQQGNWEEANKQLQAFYLSKITNKKQLQKELKNQERQKRVIKLSKKNICIVCKKRELTSMRHCKICLKYKKSCEKSRIWRNNKMNEIKEIQEKLNELKELIEQAHEKEVKKALTEKNKTIVDCIKKENKESKKAREARDRYFKHYNMIKELYKDEKDIKEIRRIAKLLAKQ